jgi:hypothetical protein
MELRHDNLRGRVQQGYVKYINAVVILAASNHRVNALWKRVEKSHPFLTLCSACPGDYEDPDWTTWNQDPSGDEELSDSIGGADHEEIHERE